MGKVKKAMRNWAAIDPLMRKGGPHRDAKQLSRPRFGTRQALQDFEQWRDEENLLTGENNEGPQGPSFLSGHLSPRSQHRDLVPQGARP